MSANTSGTRKRERRARTGVGAALGLINRLWVVGAVVLWAGCAGGEAGPSEGESTPGVGNWTVAAERVRSSVHSVWGSKPALGVDLTAFGPVGTAFVVGRNGVLLSNAHVVVRGDSTLVPRLHVLVQTDTGSTLYPARVLALDVERDLSLLAIADTSLVPLRWSDGHVPMGWPLATIGYGLPEGGVVDTARAAVTSEYTVFRRFTAGFSSGYRTLEPGDPSTNVLEVDLFLFPGVSGGPTFDLEGRVVGVNQGQHRYREGGSTSYGRVIPRLVVGQFLELQGQAAGLDSASVFHGRADP